MLVISTTQNQTECKERRHQKELQVHKTRSKRKADILARVRPYGRLSTMAPNDNSTTNELVCDTLAKRS